MKKTLRSKKVIPDKMRNLESWNLSRKNFIRTAVAGGIIAKLPILKLSASEVSAESETLNQSERQIIKRVQNILFPADGNGPGANDINALEYLEWVLADTEKDPDETRYIINGIGWLNESANEIMMKDFNELSGHEQEKIIAIVSTTEWGESWLSVILTFIFEALLCDPQYPGNPESVGWKWLNHNPGQPRPTNELIYPEILTTIRENAK